MDLHPLHRLYLGRGHGETGTIAARAVAVGTDAGTARPASPAPVAGGALRAAVVGLVALTLVGRLIGKVAGGR